MARTNWNAGRPMLTTWGGRSSEVGMLAHACEVREPRELARRHCRVVGANGLSVPLDVLYAGIAIPSLRPAAAPPSPATG